MIRLKLTLDTLVSRKAKDSKIAESKRQIEGDYSPTFPFTTVVRLWIQDSSSTIKVETGNQNLRLG